MTTETDSTTDRIEIVDLHRILYHYENGSDCLAIRVSGLRMRSGDQPWLKVPRPVPVCPGGGYSYPCAGYPAPITPDNSIHVRLAGDVVDAPNASAHSDCVWIPVQVPSGFGDHIEYLLLRTDALDLPGWGRIPPTSS